MTDKYPDDCKHRDPKDEKMCKVFDMSCAMFHTRIFGIPSECGVTRCCYYEAKP